MIAFRFGIPYSHTFGHRGFFHGLFFAALLSVAVGLIVVRLARGGISGKAITAYLFIVTATHGLLDTFTDGGLGIALLSPFSNHRFFSPFRPIVVSPISIRAFLSPWGLHVLLSEFLWIGVPCLALALVSAWLRRHGRPIYLFCRTRSR